jgi:hypothetical protein
MILFRAIDAIDTPLLSHYAIDYFTFRHYAIIDDYFRCHYFITPLLLRLISLIIDALFSLLRFSLKPLMPLITLAIIDITLLLHYYYYFDIIIIIKPCRQAIAAARYHTLTRIISHYTIATHALLILIIIYIIHYFHY